MSSRLYSSPSLLLSISLILSLCPSLLSVEASTSNLPQIDFSALGYVGAVGAFGGIELYDSSSPPKSYSTTSSTLLSKTAGGQLRTVGITNPGGTISSICQISTGQIYIGGLFTSLGGLTVSNIASYDPSLGTFSALGSGLDGQVLTLACNSTTIYAGGKFNGPVEGGVGSTLYAGHVAQWTISSKSWSPLPFAGLNGPVTTISPSVDGKSIFFGGNFTTTFINSTGSSTPSNVTFPSLASSLTPISLSGSQFTAGQSTRLEGFINPANVFCPQSVDGPGSSWLLEDGITGTFISQLFRPLQVRGLRLGNTFIDGRGTANFSITSIPDNVVLQLSYASDPTNPTSPIITCSANCPLAHNPAVIYQDFLFPNSTTITGFVINFLGWYGAGAGLHLVQLLSEGAYVYGLQEDNYSPCATGIGATMASTVITNGDWTRNESISAVVPGTIQSVVVGHMFGETSPLLAPNLTMIPYVVSNGIYSVYFRTPGCIIQGTCNARASINVVVTPTGGIPVTTIIDQHNTVDQFSLIYSGNLLASNSPNGGLTIAVTLAAGSAPDQYNFYGIVVDYVTLIAASTDGRTTILEKGYGLFEYNLGGTGTFGDAVISTTSINATSTLRNSTAIDNISFKLSPGSTINSIVTIGSGISSTVFLGGNFTYTNGASVSSNILSYSGSKVNVAPNGGLAGIVTSLVELNGFIYASGSFITTKDLNVTGLTGIAKWQYNVTGSSWQSLSPVPSIRNSIVKLGVVNSGSASSIVAIGGNGQGLAYYDPITLSWNSTQSGFFLGNLTAFGSANSISDTNGTSWYAGMIAATMSNSAPGGAILSANSNGNSDLTSFGFQLTPLTSTSLDITQQANNLVSTSNPKRAIDITGMTRSPPSRLAISSVNTTLPSPLNTLSTSSQILAGAFWKNGSTTLMLLGGRFISTTGINNLGLYDMTKKTLISLIGESVKGVVTALAVFGDVAWIGGNFTTTSNRQGFTTYNLATSTLDDSQPALMGYAGSNATVNVILQRPGYTSTIVVAGAFSAAGSLPCQSICSWDTGTLQWTALGSGLVGAVGSIGFAGSNSEYLIAAGSFNLAGTPSYLAQWSYGNQSWSSIGSPSDIPGPATAVSADNADDSKIFAAGTSLTGLPYLYFWNGTTWSDINNGTLQLGSGIEQLLFVPLVSDHSSNSIIESNRMLLVSGDLTINQTSISSALFDGQFWHPYLISTANSGTGGVISQLFYSVTNFQLSPGHFLSVGIVILISIAIALGCVFLLVLIGLLIALARRRDEEAYPVQESNDNDSNYAQREPNLLLATVGAATAVLLDGKGEKSISPDSAAYGGQQFEDSAARARFSFVAEGPLELSIKAGEDLTVLEASDVNWWLVSSTQSGKRGLVPSAYLA